MGLSDDLKRFSVKVDRMTQDVFVNVCSATKASITDGSPLTGAPGQPVDTGALKASWQLEFETPTSALISTNLVYAKAVEDGVGPHGPVVYGTANKNSPSQVGGSFSVAQTIAGFGRIVADETAKAAE